MITIRQATAEDAPLLKTLAHSIWWQFYPPIIGDDQVRYMLDKFSSEDYIRAQMAQQFDYFIVYQGDDAVGYIGVENRPPSFFISKFYLDESRRGRGFARKMLTQMEQTAKDRGLTQLELTVNKYNPSYQIYLKLGFTNVEDLVMDIGGGFVMDDYRMVKPL